MPVKPENAKRYPPNWKDLRRQVLERAGHRCEQCGVRNYALVQTVGGKRRCAGGSIYYDDFHYTASFKEANEARTHLNEFEDEEPFIVIVLTIAHLDHDELETTDITRLRAWCQKCHLSYDHEHHMKNARITRRSRKAMGELFA